MTRCTAPGRAAAGHVRRRRPAERTPLRRCRRPTPAPARVIVTLKADAPLLREQALSVRAVGRAVAAAVAQRRADRLAARAGVPLEQPARPSASARRWCTAERHRRAPRWRARLAADPEVLHAPWSTSAAARLLVPNDPLYARGPASGRGPDVGQWYLRAPAGEVRSAINAEAAWDRITGSASVVVAVLDTGVLRRPPGPGRPGAARLRHGVATRPSPTTATAATPMPATRATGSPAAENSARGGDFHELRRGRAAPGTAPRSPASSAPPPTTARAWPAPACGVKILPVRVLGKCGGYDSDIQAGMRWAAGLARAGRADEPEPGARHQPEPGRQRRVQRASGYPAVIAELQAAGTVVVAAAGNSAGHAVELPANCPGVIAVAGAAPCRHEGRLLRRRARRSSISAPGGNCVNLDVGEPCLYPILTSSNSGTQRPNAGGSICTDSFDYSVGTSFAAPIVAGTAALDAVGAAAAARRHEVRTADAGQRARLPDQRRRQRRERPAGADVPRARRQRPAAVLLHRRPVRRRHARRRGRGAGRRRHAGAHRHASRPRRWSATPLRLSAAASLVASGRSIVGYEWSLIDNPGVVAGFSRQQPSARAPTCRRPAAGTVTVSLVVTDDAGPARHACSAASSSPPRRWPTRRAVGGGGGGGGGASSVLWVCLLALAVAALLHTRPRGTCRGHSRRPRQAPLCAHHDTAAAVRHALSRLTRWPRSAVRAAAAGADRSRPTARRRAA